jgi:hypothetical protein
MKRNFACGYVWMWNLVSDMKGRIQTESVWGQGAGENNLREENLKVRRLEGTEYWEFHNCAPR